MRMHDLDDLITMKQISDLAGLSPGAVPNWLRRGLGFPEHIAVIGDVRVWSRAEVTAWLKATNRLP